MLRLYCENSACDGPITRDDYDCPFCRVCGSIFCCETCLTEHVAQQHPHVAQQADEFAERFGFPRAAE